MTAPHPAKFSQAILELLDKIVPDGVVLDPFAGVGGCFQLAREGRSVWGIEIEEEWVTDNPRHICGDATQMNEWFKNESFDAICTSPVYGSRMSDHHEAKDSSKRHTYRHYLGRPLSENNAGQMFAWQESYWSLHAKVWSRCWDVLKKDGVFILNTKNFIRNGEVFDLTGKHCQLLVSLGFEPQVQYEVETPGQRHGANGALRVPCENVTVYRKVGG